jgi:GTP-binding protein Era
MAYRAGHVAIVGRPNVGKSTLLNRLVGQKISITSARAQTTRHRVCGIVTSSQAQIVFVDTPGYQTRYGGPLNRRLNRIVCQSLGTVDLVMFIVEAGQFDFRDRQVLSLVPAERPVICVINKIDTLADKSALLPFIGQISAAFDFAEVIPVSAERGVQLDLLADAVAARLPEGEKLYRDDEITDRSERFLAAELLREKLFRMLGEDVPYAAAVVIDSFTEDKGLRRIHATIYVNRPGQKAIIIGAQGEKMKALATAAREDMEHLFGGKVFLEVWVKVQRGWDRDERVLTKLGYE